MEVKSLKLSENMSYSDTVEAIVPSILDILKSDQPQAVADFVKKVQEVLSEWEPFIKELLYEEEDFHILIRSVEVYCGSGETAFNSAFHIILQVLFKLGILKSGHILKWYEQVVQSLSQVKNNGE
mmetsp:Transcript_1309/g.1350  ORF Transcript_1309/g.1350 Transcript_1309/m.1350 type:complete len:125 (+) Transcript_1309:161-535(+)